MTEHLAEDEVRLRHGYVAPHRTTDVRSGALPSTSPSIFSARRSCIASRWPTSSRAPRKAGPCPGSTVRSPDSSTVLRMLAM
jgi:hypothetical protein